MRNGILWAVLLVILLTTSVLIAGKERLLAEGEMMLLSLAPADPRSLLQGDYMTLRYRLANEVSAQLSAVASAEGRIVVRLDQNHVADFVRVHDSAQPLSADERLLFFRKRGEVVRLATDAFFFQEGRGRFYRGARYGELRVDAVGDAVLVGLRDDELKPMSVPP